MLLALFTTFNLSESVNRYQYYLPYIHRYPEKQMGLKGVENSCRYP